MVASRRTADGETCAQHLDGAFGFEHEAPEDHDHDRGGGRDHLGCGGQAIGDRGPTVACAVPLLPNT